MDTPNNPRRLYRSSTDRIIAGVCGGIAEYTHTDPTVIRLIFIVLAFFGGSSIIVYILLVFFVPSQDDVANGGNPKNAMKDFVEKAADTVQGAAHEFKSAMNSPERMQIRSERRRRRALFFGTLLVILGVFFLARQIFPYYLFPVRGEIIWPIILILLGAYFLSRPR